MTPPVKPESTADDKPVIDPIRELTVLSPKMERQFRGWAKTAKIADLDAPESFYDYRGYWHDVVRAGKDLTQTFADGIHFPDTYKRHGHPTFSSESRYSKGLGDGGYWLGEFFVPEAAAKVMADLLKTLPPPKQP